MTFSVTFIMIYDFYDYETDIHYEGLKVTEINKIPFVYPISQSLFCT